MPYNIDSKQAVILNRYFARIDASTSEFQSAILPFLNSGWNENSELLIAKLQSFSDKQKSNIYRECILATKDYINSRDFIAPNKYEATSYFYGALQYNSESQALKNLNQKLDQLIQNIPGKNISWQENFENLWCKTALTLFSAFDFAKEHPFSTITALLYGQVALASAFPAVFNLSSLDGTNGFKINGEAINDGSGISVSFAGDINGDGIADLIVGASGNEPAGASYVIFGKTENWATPLELSTLNGVNGFKINGEAKYDSSGRSVGFVGDVNGDGIDDLIIGAPGASINEKIAAGSSHVIFGKNETWATPFELSTLNGTNGFKMNGEAVDDHSGYSVSYAGDINGDGIDDLIIGAYHARPNDLNQAGSSYVIFGKTENWTMPLELSALNGTNGFKLNGEAKGDESGISVSYAGDVNGDGIDDLIIGAYWATPNGVVDEYAGSSYVIFGKTESWVTPFELSTLNGTNGFKINGEIAWDYSGISVSSAGDINGDGIDDLLIGAYSADPNGKSSAGASYVIFGKNETWITPFELSTLNGTNGFKINGEAKDDRSGYSVSSAGDINGDGIDDLIVGAYEADPHGNSSAGSSYVIFGKHETWTTPFELSTLNGTNGFKINGEVAYDYSGYSVSSAGDINGDGIDDLIIGAPNADPNGESAAGSSYVIFGVNLPPILTGNSSSINYVENESAKIIDDSITVTDVDNWNLVSGAVSIGNNFQAGDKLSFIDQNGIVGFYNNITGVLTLTGSAEVAYYQAALRNITYHHLSDNPTVAPRNISFIVNDRWHDSNPIFRVINIIAVNDAPVLTNDGGSFDYTENDPATVVDSSITISDVDNIDLTNATIAITNNFYYPEDILIFMDQNGISGIYNNATGVLTLTGSASVVDYQTALRSITYEDSSDNPAADVRTVTFRVNDGVDNSNAITRNINIIPINDAPVLSSDGGSFDYTENDPATVVDSSITISDVDNVDLTNATIAITNNFYYPEDILIFMDQNGIGGIYNNATGVLTLTGSASVVDYQTALRSITYEDSSDNPTADVRTITFRVNDGVDNSNAVTRNINIIPVNDAPVLSSNGGSFDYTENDPATVVDSSITISDVDNVDLTNATIAITNNFYYPEDILIFMDQNGISGIYNNATGVLTLTGSASVVDYQTALRSIAYEDSSDNPAADVRTVTFRVNDGVDNSNAITRDINIIPINDAPVLSSDGGSFNYTENDPATIIDSSITISDVDNANLANATIAITNNFYYPEDILIFMDQNGISGFYNDVAGILTLTGSSSIAHYQTALRNVTYENLSEGPSTDMRTVTFMVNDGIANSNAVTREINVISINDVPVLTNSGGSFNYTENDPATIIDSSIIITDDADELNNATIVITNNFHFPQDVLIFTDQNDITGFYNSAVGRLILTGFSNITNYQEALRSISYENLSEDPVTDPRTVAFTVNNGLGDSNVITRQINIISVNDVPVLTNAGGGFDYTENDPAMIIDSSIIITDVDNINLTNATIAVTNNFHYPEDVLTFIDQNGIGGFYNNATGVLTLTGSSSIAHYQTALRNVTYENLSKEPSTAMRTVSFMVNDGIGNSNPVTRDINIIAINDAPVLANSGGGFNYTENDPATIIDASIVITDDSTDLVNATIVITNNFHYPEDVLTFINQNGISGLYHNATGVLTLTGSSNITNYQSALCSVKYENLADNPVTDIRTVTFTVNDGLASSNTVFRDISIIAVNDMPVLTHSDSSLNYTENDPATIIDPNITIFDGDNDNLSGGAVSIISNFDFTQDRLVFTNQNGISGSYNSGMGVLTLTGSSSVANYQTALCSVKYENIASVPATNIRTISFVVTDGDAESVAVTRDINVILTNDVPQIVRNELSINQGQKVYITQNYLSAIDEETPAVDLLFNISNIQHGYFENIYAQGISLLSFQQRNIIDYEIQFVHDGSTQAPTYSVTVSDGFLTTPPSTVTVNFNINREIVDDGGFDFGGKLFNTILLASIGGLIGFLFLALRICLYRKATQSFEKLTSIGDVSTTEQQRKFQTNILRPIAQAIFDRIKITGCLGYISDKRMQDYLSVVTQLIVALQQQAINVDLDNLSPASQSLLINVIAKQTENVLLPAQGCCTCGACCRCIGRLCSAEVSPEVLEAKVVAIAIAIKNALKRNNYDSFLSNQMAIDLTRGAMDLPAEASEVPIEMAVLGDVGKFSDRPMEMPLGQSGLFATSREQHDANTLFQQNVVQNRMMPS